MRVPLNIRHGSSLVEFQSGGAITDGDHYIRPLRRVYTRARRKYWNATRGLTMDFTFKTALRGRHEWELVSCARRLPRAVRQHCVFVGGHVAIFAPTQSRLLLVYSVSFFYFFPFRGVERFPSYVFRPRWLPEIGIAASVDAVYGTRAPPGRPKNDCGRAFTPPKFPNDLCIQRGIFFFF